MKTFIYTNSLLVEKNPYTAHSEEPSYYKKFLQRGCDRIPIDFYNKCVKHTLFLEYQATIETLPVSGTGWIEGQEYVEGKDFERQWQTKRVGSSDWDLKLKEPNKAEKERCETRQAAVLINNSTVEITKLSDKIGHLTCDPEALKDPKFVEAINEMAELAYKHGILKAYQR